MSGDQFGGANDERHIGLALNSERCRHANQHKIHFIELTEVGCRGKPPGADGALHRLRRDMGHIGLPQIERSNLFSVYIEPGH